MPLLRIFIAIEIPLSIRQAIYEQTASLRQDLGSERIRWVPLENLHLTLKFIGEVSSNNVALLADMLAAEAQGHVPFPIEIGGLGAFPSPRQARVIWVGIQASPALASLQRGIEAAAVRLGYEAEPRPFSPHLTIGRVRQPLPIADRQRIRTVLENTTIGSLGTTFVTAIHLYKSDLKPGGAEYTRLFSASLRVV